MAEKNSIQAEETRVDKQTYRLKCCIYALGAYSLVSFLWVAFIATGISNGNTDIGDFASRLVVSNIAIAFFSAVFGFSFLLFKTKMSQPAKRTLHVLLNYVAAMVCFYALHSNLKGNADVTASMWIIVIFFASLVFFVIYGVVSLVSFLVKRK